MAPPKNFPHQRPILLYGAAAIVGFLVAFGLYLVMGGSRTALPEPSSSGTALIGGPFELVDQDGRLVTDQSFAGKPMLLYFGYTSCPDICPIDLHKLAKALDLLGEDGKALQPIFVTIDPERDNPEVIKKYLSRISGRITGLTGTPDQIADIAHAYKVYYAKTDIEEDGSYWMSHSNIFYLMDSTGHFVQHFDAEATPQKMAEILRRNLK
ncbi:MAG: SCO family protein [Alphaproteobacteria bacterium]|nr:MAG: SCO family protein [Alphaproteobacteria bacterium]